MTIAAHPSSSVGTTTGQSTHGRVAVLDGLRLAAAIFVVLFHWTGQGQGAWGEPSMPQLFPYLHSVAQYGWMGVHLFFLISGFVICMSAWGKPLGDFFLSRAVRLYPTFWFAVIATTAVVTVLPLHTTRLSASEVAFNLTMVAEPWNVSLVDGVYWTLWTEMKFYLLFALVVWRGVTYRRVVAFCALWTAASMLATASNEPLMLEVFTPEYSMYFVGGIAFYLMYRFRPSGLLWGIVGFSFLHTQYMMAREAPQASLSTGAPQHWWVSVPLLAVFYLLMAGVALGWMSRIRWRWLTTAGALTFPLYLLHDVIGFTAIRWLEDAVPHWPLMLGLLAVMLVVSWLVHRYFERPVSAWLKRLIRQGIVDMRDAEPGSHGSGVDGRPLRLSVDSCLCCGQRSSANSATSPADRTVNSS
ncbi:acyltransferase [Dactylosporangium sp. NPDC049525]|uniref:acyltransferase family protein n=1 Tax=Dactylosporangium sp. NPDC049525 TaxID=3154730 RepID=UPI003442AC4A